MAEVKINIVAQDMATPVLKALKGSMESLLSVAGGAGRALKAISDVKVLFDSIDTDKALRLDVSQALMAASQVKASIDAIPHVTTKTVVVRYQTQASPVMPFTEGIKHIRSLMESLPTDGTYTLRFSGLSPLRERLNIMRDRAIASGAGIRALGRFGPMSSVFEIDRIYRAYEAQREAAVRLAEGTQHLTFSPTINVNASSGSPVRELARELDVELARMWRYNRSELRRAMQS